MLYLKADEPRTLTFEVDIRGVGKAELSGYVRFFINDSEHGFPVSIDDGVITADIPPLTEIIRLKTMEDGDVIEAKLDLMTDQHIFTPWQGEVKISVPMGIKAKLSNETLKSVNVGSPVVAKVVESKEDKAITEEIKTSEEQQLEDEEVKYKKDLVSLVADTIKQLGLVSPGTAPEALMEKDKIIKEEKKKSKVNETEILKKKIRNISEEGIYKYMEKAGTKNKKIQKLIYEQSVAAAGSSEPFQVLKQVIKILKKRR